MLASWIVYTVDWGGPEMRCVLRTFGFFVTEFCESFGNIIRHGNIDPAFGIIPDECETQVCGAGPIFGDDIFFFESGEKVIGISFGEIFDAEIVDSECECGAPSIVFPDARSERHMGA